MRPLGRVCDSARGRFKVADDSLANILNGRTFANDCIYNKLLGKLAGGASATAKVAPDRNLSVELD